jgi:AcrR family transcriptional regulator
LAVDPDRSRDCSHDVSADGLCDSCGVDGATLSSPTDSPVKRCAGDIPADDEAARPARDAAPDATPDAPSANEPSQARRRGRTLEQAIFHAVLEQMNVVGFSGLTMEGVAACARTGKAALYRRWQCKEDLVVDALNDVLPSFDDPPDTGRVRDDVADVLRRMVRIINSRAGCALLGLFTELDKEHPFVKTVHARVLGPRKVMMCDILERAVRRGEIRADVVTPLTSEAGPAMIIHQAFVDGPPIDEAFVDAVVDQVVMPMLSAPAKPRPT